MKIAALFSLVLLLLFPGCASISRNSVSSGKEWSEYLGGPDRNHYTTLKQITRDNVMKLQPAWEYHTGIKGQLQCNPIMVNGILYGMTASTQPFAVDAATGKEIWRRTGEDEKNNLNTSRGLSYWEKGKDRRILFTSGAWLYAVDAFTGKPVLTFGENGRTSLKSGLDDSVGDKFVISNTPGTIYKDLIIMPLRVSESENASLGHIQAFNIITGKLAWVFRTIPHPGEFGYDTWPEDTYKNELVGAANNWAGMAVDRQRGIVYVPTGSAANDFYGANRKGANLFANTLLALDAGSGKRIWHFQFVHHDILDRDPPAPPNLVTITRNGKKIDAVAQVTKQGVVFVFDRVTGEPLFPSEERPVPASDIPGEEAWPTQPFPLKPAPFARQTFTEADINPWAENKAELVELFRKSRAEGPFTPLSNQGTIIFPGLDGGAEWGGAAADPAGILYVNSNEMPWRISLDKAASGEELKGLSPGAQLYNVNCASCHGPERKGNPVSGFPSLVDIGRSKSPQDISTVISRGKGMMPAITKLTEQEKKTLVSFLMGEEKQAAAPPKPSAPAKKAAAKAPYQISGYSKFLDKNKYPAVKPPWGTLNAINLNTGEYLWKVPFGEYPELTSKGMPLTGSESYGGPVVTASGLLIIAGTKDGKLRVFDKLNGRLLWETQLPAAAFATPTTYEIKGKQYIVLACGGSKLGATQGDSYVAYSLP